MTVEECFVLALRKWRRSAGITQRQAGERAGLSKAAWGTRERHGEHSPLSVLECIRVGIDPNELAASARRIAAVNGVKWPVP